MDRLRFGIDSLVFRDRLIFGFGWIFHECKEISEVSLEVSFAESNRTCSIAVEHGKPRSDVEATYPTSSHSLHSGFIVYGACSDRLDQGIHVSLVGRLGNGDCFAVQIPSANLRSLENEAAPARHRIVLDRTKQLVHRASVLVRQGRFSDLAHKAKTQFMGGSRFDAGVPPQISDSETSWWGGAKLSEPTADGIVDDFAPSDLERSVLVIDHDLGGGANQYRYGVVAQHRENGSTVFVFTYSLVSLSYMLLIFGRKSHKRYLVSGPRFVLDLAHKVRFSEVIYNNAVSFPSPEEIPQLIVALKSVGHPLVTLLLHDYFMVCPSHFLLNDQGVFCEIPDERRCQDCLRNNRQGFMTLVQTKDIVRWRAAWGEAMGLADQIIAFSNSSLQLLSRAYPNMDLAHAKVSPHKVKHILFHRLEPSYAASLRIGVVGHVAYHKGASIVQDLAREISRRGLDIQIVVFGTLDAACPKDVVRVTGPYAQANLPNLILDAGVNIFLFPSICPETFSYVVQELLELQCPVACFDLGAPAERLRSYRKGLILRSQSASYVLDSLINFHRNTYLVSERKI